MTMQIYKGGILHNIMANRFHPILFRPAPMPSGADAALSAQRYRSKAHHTEGFDTLEEANAWLDAREDTQNTGAVWSWDGDGTPAMTEWFSA